MEKFGIPTRYNGVQFRSRLEAKWAAFFDLLKWDWEYEPIDLPGWIPDFIITSKKGNKILVEIKPNESFEEIKYLTAIHNSPFKKSEILLLENGISNSKEDNNFIQLGKIITWYGNESSTEPCLITVDKCYGFFSYFGSFENRITNVYDGDHHLNPGDINEIKGLWKEACNKTQWKK